MVHNQEPPNNAMDISMATNKPGATPSDVEMTSHDDVTNDDVSSNSTDVTFQNGHDAMSESDAMETKPILEEMVAKAVSVHSNSSQGDSSINGSLTDPMEGVTIVTKPPEQVIVN